MGLPLWCCLGLEWEPRVHGLLFAAVEEDLNPGLAQITYLDFKNQIKPTDISENDLSHLCVYVFLLQALEMLLWFTSVPPKGAGGGVATDGEKDPIKQNVIGLQKGTDSRF